MNGVQSSASLKDAEKNEKAFNEFNEIYDSSDIVKKRKKHLSFQAIVSKCLMIKGIFFSAGVFQVINSENGKFSNNSYHYTSWHNEIYVI